MKGRLGSQRVGPTEMAHAPHALGMLRMKKRMKTKRGQ